MKEPRFTLSIEVTYNEYLGLLWSIDGTKRGFEPQKNTIKKIKAFDRIFMAKHDAWRKTQFKCAGKK